MLVLTRRAGETIKIGDNVEVTLLAVNGNQISIGIAAPKEITILRGELEGKQRKDGRAEM